MSFQAWNSCSTDLIPHCEKFFGNISDIELEIVSTLLEMFAILVYSGIVNFLSVH